ncbi:glutathione S-transferase [Rubricella aquisinus]|uniref:Glutathione S-transferase n=1 Tax=Rubricella aquisinus TaxID=2028108 RepID=A0A840WYC7_9RHOB|nr:glutathione S-transferase [Rubricella aquisinus]MBB5514676.1 glutathione S-transferase [Rubricella aquisinus]
MQLYDNPASPYCRKVRILLHETGLMDQVHLTTVAGNAADPGTMPVTVNPLGKIPCLVRDTGPALYDSRVICAYLDDLAGAGLYGTGSARWDILTLEALADGMLDAALAIVYEARIRDEAMRHEGWVEGQWDKIARALDALEGRWIAFLSGPMTMGHIAVASALGYLDFRLDARGWRGRHPALAEWFAAVSERPALQATRPA